MNPDLIVALAAKLREAQDTRTAVDPVRGQLGDDDGTLAYAIQAAQTQARIAGGDRVVGRKVGLTSPVVQRQLGVAQPDFGTLLATMTRGDDLPISLKCFIQPKVEAEVALVLERDLPHERHTFVDIIRATAFALPAIEIVDSRIRGWDIRFLDTVADNASSAAYVLGSRPVQLRDLDLVACEMRMNHGGQTVSSGSGAACLGNPLNAAVWLADRMVRVGTPLRAGDVVLTGALGPMVAVPGPARYEAHIQGLGSVRAAFTD
jgi:2-keto-4-pentenoate hydratase